MTRIMHIVIIIIMWTYHVLQWHWTVRWYITESSTRLAVFHRMHSAQNDHHKMIHHSGIQNISNILHGTWNCYIIATRLRPSVQYTSTIFSLIRASFGFCFIYITEVESRSGWPKRWGRWYHLGDCRHRWAFQNYADTPSPSVRERATPSSWVEQEHCNNKSSLKNTAVITVVTNQILPLALSIPNAVTKPSPTPSNSVLDFRQNLERKKLGRPALEGERAAPNLTVVCICLNSLIVILPTYFSPSPFQAWMWNVLQLALRILLCPNYWNYATLEPVSSLMVTSSLDPRPFRLHKEEGQRGLGSRLGHTSASSD